MYVVLSVLLFFCFFTFTILQKFEYQQSLFISCVYAFYFCFLILKLTLILFLACLVF